MSVSISGLEYVAKQCPECGVVHYIPSTLENECKKRGRAKAWYCPNGHARVYSSSEADILRRERDRLIQSLAQRDDEIAEQRQRREEADRQAAAARGQVTKLKNRAKAGLCPCCNRHFTNLERHMANKHSEETVL